MKKVKTDLAVALQNVQGAEKNAADAKGFLETQEALFEAADGPVGKIGLMWNVVGAKQGYSAAVAARSKAVADFATAMDHALTVINQEVEAAAASNTPTKTTESLKEAMEEVQK